jgi:HK97 gp10 family phage protein
MRQPSSPRGSHEAARVAIGPTREGWYLRFPELGTSKMPAHPWLRPALDTRWRDAFKILRERLGRRIRDAWTRNVRRPE